MRKPYGTTYAPNGDLWITHGALLNFERCLMNMQHPILSLVDPREPVWWTYRTVEHRYQAMKSLYLLDGDWCEIHDRIASAEDPQQAKKLGRQIEIDTVLWDRAAFGYMVEAHTAKFFQNAYVRKYLLATEDRRLVEHRPDPIWGDNMDGSGLNLCGSSLMIVRNIVRDYFSEREF